MNLKQILYTDLCMVGNKQKKALKEYQKEVSKFDYTYEGRLKIRRTLFPDITEEAKNRKAEGEKALDEAIQKVTAEEAVGPANRASNDYLKRLELKIDMAKNVDKNDVSTETMRKYFEEFAGDPMAIAALRARLPKEYVGAIPDNNTGFRAKHLKVVKALFTHYMDSSVEVLGLANPSLTERPVGLPVAEEEPLELPVAEIEVFKQYVLMQNAEFTLDDERILNWIAEGDKKLKAGAETIKEKLKKLMHSIE